MKKKKGCQDRIRDSKTITRHTKNLLKDADIEEDILIDEICENIEDE